MSFDIVKEHKQYIGTEFLLLVSLLLLSFLEEGLSQTKVVLMPSVSEWLWVFSELLWVYTPFPF